MPFYRGGLFSLTFLGRLLVEFTAPQLGENARLFTGTLEATQGGVKIFILTNTNAGHSNLKSWWQRPPKDSATGGRILKCAPTKGKNMRVLGIESSCDETAVAVYDGARGLLSHRLHSQIALHQAYGGVVPELASRDHVADCCLWSGKRSPRPRRIGESIDGVAYTAGPGLIGALLVGAGFAAGLAQAWGKPALGIHHLEGHLLAPLLEPDAAGFPFLALLVSGGHTQLVDVAALGRYRILGETLDDAAGEAFDKTAKLLGLPYPGGAALAALAEHGRSGRFAFPASHAGPARARFQFQWPEDRGPSSLARPGSR